MLVSSFCASRPRDATRRMSATELVCAAPSQQRLRRSSVAAALRAASAPSQQHQLDATRRMSATELVCAYPSQQRLRRSSDSVAAPSQQRCAHHERSTGHWAEQPLGKICQKQGDTMTQLLLFNTLISLKSLGHSPAPGFFFWGVLK